MELHKMTVEELNKLVKDANKELDRRNLNRQKELWGNIIAAIKKYEHEIGSIYFETPAGHQFTIDGLIIPGNITLK